MLDRITIMNNYKPESLHIAKYEGVIVNSICSQAFLFKEINMRYIRRDKAPLCECGCRERAKPGNRFLYGHNRKGTKLSKEHKRKILEANKGGFVMKKFVVRLLITALFLSLMGCFSSRDRVRLDHRLQVGMTKQEIYVSWKYPTRKHVSSDGREMWVYRIGSRKRTWKVTYIFFREGRVVSWSTTVK